MSPVNLSHAADLERIPWQYFGSLTFKQAEMSGTDRRCMVFALFRKLAKPLQVKLPQLLWVLRLEEGEITRRRHFHLLIGGLPHWSISKRSCFAIMRTWEGLGGGMARVRMYNPRLSGVDYLKKGLGFQRNLDADGNPVEGIVTSMPDAVKTLQGANSYELGKFSSEEVLELMCGQSVIEYLDRRLNGSPTRRQRMSS